MAGIRSVAILPFVDRTDELNHTLQQTDLRTIAERFANHLVGSETFSTILYPQQALDILADTSYSMTRKDDLKEIGNLLDVDALIFGVIKQYSMYYPPRMSISMRFYLTRMDRFAASNEIAELAHSGVPLHSYNPTFFRQLWDTSAYYDGSNSIFRQKLDHYLSTHQSASYGFQDERFLRTKSDFFDLLAYDLSGSLNNDKRAEENMRPAPLSKGKGKPPRPSGYFHR